MPRALWLPDQLAAFGLRVVLHDGWQTRGSTDFDPKVVVAHHTAVKGSAVNVCIKGRPDLAGPLCNVVLARDGVAHVIAAGKANHAGAGGWKGYSGNRRALGIEAENDGFEPWPATQVDAFQLCAAAMCAGIGQDPSFVCGHKEWAPGRKTDPHTLDMTAFRAAVGLDLHNLHAQATEGEDDMPQPSTVVAALSTPNDDGVWLLQYDGGVRTTGKAQFYGSYPGLPAKDRQGTRGFVAIEPHDGGYQLIADDGAVYRFGAKK